MNRYEYRTLQRSKNEIRLLKLLPTDAKENLTPACEMFHISLHEQPKFEALSYVWGDTTNQRIILLGNSEVRVTKNLYDALMALRPPEEAIVIWIDALCINQSDDAEKSWQVRLMADIYRAAYKVVAWLGPAESDDDSVIDYLNSLGAKAEAFGMDHGFQPYDQIWYNLALQPLQCLDLRCSIGRVGTPTGDILCSPQEELHRLFYSISGWHDQDNLLPIAGIKRFFTRSWWGRIWVLQEIVLPENAEFICGTKRITRRRCTAALNACHALSSVFRKVPIQQSLTFYQSQILLTGFWHRASVMLSSWNVYRCSKFPLAALLRATCVGTINPDRHGPHNLESTDPKDKIFALLGLAEDQKQLETLGVVPDYSKSCEEVYATTMVALLQQGHGSLLSFCQKREVQPKLILPSWVPDWSRSATHMLQDVKDDHVTVYPEFRASGEQSSGFKVTAVMKEQAAVGIAVKSHIYDEIYEMGSFPSRASSHEVPLIETYSWPVQWLVAFIRLTYRNRHYFRNFSDRLHAAARTSIGGVGYGEEKELVRVGDDRFLDAVIILGHAIKCKQIKDDRIKLELQRLLKNPKFKRELKNGPAPAFSRLGPEIIGKSLGRLPFITRKGHLVLGPEYVQRGDLVALIKGTQVPYILRRRSDGQYQLVGEAYVDRIMDGEAMKGTGWSEIHLI